MIGYDEATQRVLEIARPLQSETVTLAEAHNRVLAEAVRASSDAPRVALSAMDGWAVRSEDIVEGPARLRIAGEVFAGGDHAGRVQAGECIRIYTGAPLPPGADRVVIQELVTRDGGYAVLPHPVPQARHVRAPGSDFRQGDVLLAEGRRLDARALVTVAAADTGSVKVVRAPELAILSTGDELAEPGTARLDPRRIPESLSVGLAAMASDWGGRTISRKRLGDDPVNLSEAAMQALDRADVVVVTGGASVGERDYARSMFAEAGLELIFGKVAIKPGKPVWIGRASGKLVVGLPGNPTSALVTARLFLAPLIAGLSGRDPQEALSWSPRPLLNGLPACGDRETFHRGALASTGEVELIANQDSGAQKALAAADVLVRSRAGDASKLAGEQVETLRF